jgi:hypothetical protein
MTIIQTVTEELRPILEGSPQGIYVFLDEAHKVCNGKFAEMLGYESPADWDRPVSFTDQYVDPASHQTLVSTYRHAMEHQVGAMIDVTWKRLDGGSVPTSVILVPIALGGALMALHFVTPR